MSDSNKGWCVHHQHGQLRAAPRAGGSSLASCRLGEIPARSSNHGLSTQLWLLQWKWFSVSWQDKTTIQHQHRYVLRSCYRDTTTLRRGTHTESTAQTTVELFLENRS